MSKNQKADRIFWWALCLIFLLAYSATFWFVTDYPWYLTVPLVIGFTAVTMWMFNGFKAEQESEDA